MALSSLQADCLADRLRRYRRIIVLTEGHATSGHAKTAISLLRYRGDHVVAVLDSSVADQSCEAVFGAGGETPLCSSLNEIPMADAMFVGIAPPGGKIPADLKNAIADCLRRGIDVVSGLHEFVSEMPELATLARAHGAQITDLRKNKATEVAVGADFPKSNLRIHTVGHDCSVGKMVVALEIDHELKRRGCDSQFVATGQTGIMINGHGVPVDAVVADYISGAVESQIASMANHDVLLIEGQGCIAHPSFSAVTLGLLHGCAPQGLIMCYDATRRSVLGLPDTPLLPLPRLVELYESMASVRGLAKVIGVAINSRGLSSDEAARERTRVSQELQLPACDVYRDGPGMLADAVVQYREEIIH